MLIRCRHDGRSAENEIWNGAVLVKDNVEFVATCMFGLEKLVAEDIEALGYERTETIDGRVTFRAPLDAAARCNIFFRYAERVLIKVGSFTARSFEELFQGTKSLKWSDMISSRDAFPVKGHSIRSTLFSVSDCQSIVKKAIVTQLSQVYGISIFPETGVKYQIEFFIINDVVTMMVDTSGAGLHKRGYRPRANLAPLRETLAAAMVRISRPRAGVMLLDPMCGSGTIAIEAAMETCGIAPGSGRDFAAESYPFISPGAWSDAREEAKANVRLPLHETEGSDIDPEAVEIAKENAKRAGVDKYVRFSVRDVLDYKKPSPDTRGTVVMNPPYGERMGDIESVHALLGKMHEVFEREIPAWQLYILSSDIEFERWFRRRADKSRRLYNGMIRCSLYQYFKKR